LHLFFSPQKEADNFTLINNFLKAKLFKGKGKAIFGFPLGLNITKNKVNNA